MNIRVSNVQLPLDAGLPGADSLIRDVLGRSLGVPAREILDVELIRRSVDARKKQNVHFVATFAVELPDGVRLDPVKGVQASPYVPPRPLSISDCSRISFDRGEPRPLVVGTGPAGLFAAYYLARAGLRPLVVERGASVDQRIREVQGFGDGGPLNPQTNVQFGEGGAGTFSDGKLNTGIKSPHIRHVLQVFADAGAPSEILWQAHPHIGTDLLPDVVKRIRQNIQDLGGEVLFQTQLVNVEIREGHITGAWLQGDRTYRVDASRVILACGHSARDTLMMLRDAGFAMERKPFAVGVRIEHPQSLINHAQYGPSAGHPALGAAEYKLAVHTSGGRGVYTFCMCPGGTVMAASSEDGGLCVNGMSTFARDGQNANSALLVGLEPDDFSGDDVMAGVWFQRELEQAAYRLGVEASPDGGERAAYTAPVSTVGDFLSNDEGHPSTMVRPTYPRGHAWCNLRDCLPDFVVDAFVEAFPLLDRKLHGFAHPQAVMTAVEARSSCPVRLLRDDRFQAMLADASHDVGQGHSGLYPCGEGAGYAGGIMSAAVDGLRVAESIVDEICSHH